MSFVMCPLPPGSLSFRIVRHIDFQGSFSDFFEYFLAGKVLYGSFFEYERRYKTEIGGEDRNDHVFHTTFEAIKRDPADAMRKIGIFLEKERSEEFYRNLVEKTSFDNVKTHRDAQRRYR